MAQSRIISPLRQARVTRKLSLDELGLQSGIERSKLGRAERGYAQLRADELEAIAGVLGIDAKNLSPMRRVGRKGGAKMRQEQPACAPRPRRRRWS